MITFEEINTPIQEFIRQNSEDWYGLPDKNYKLPLSDAIFCATDIPRNRGFFRAIQKAVTKLKTTREKIHLVYAGSGTGILGFFALACGADSALFLEHNPYSLEFSQKLAKELEMNQKITFQQADATQVPLSKSYDLLISETLTSGFVHEDFPKIIGHLLQFQNEDAIILPEAFAVNVTEKGELDRKLKERQFHFQSLSGFRDQDLIVSPETVNLSWETRCTLYDDVVLESGDCISFLNTQIQPLYSFAHPFFRLQQQI